MPAPNDRSWRSPEGPARELVAALERMERFMLIPHASPSGFSIAIHRRASTTFVSLRGVFGHGTSAALEDGLRSAAALQTTSITVDLEHAELRDGSAARRLIDAAARAFDQGTTFAFFGATDEHRRLLEDEDWAGVLANVGPL